MEQEFLNAYIVDLKYVRDLSKADNRVMSISPQTGKDMRPFIGVVVVANDKKYCIPLTSPKNKFNVKSKEDFIKIPDPKLKDENGAPQIIGILNLNNMIPVSDEVITKIHFSDKLKLSSSAQQLLFNELKWCRDNVKVISNRANKLYNKITQNPEKDRNLTRRCCDFKKLEAVLNKWLAKEQSIQQSAKNPVVNEYQKPVTISRKQLKDTAARIRSEAPAAGQAKKKDHEIE